MKLKHLPFLALVFTATTLIVGCGDDSNHLSAADQAWVKQQRLMQMYGGTTTTTTSTQISYVTITSTTTVNVAH